MAKNKGDTQLTSVKLLKGVYKEFKMTALQQGTTLQEVVNRTAWLYTNDPEFRKIIDDSNNLQISGSF